MAEGQLLHASTYSGCKRDAKVVLGAIYRCGRQKGLSLPTLSINHLNVTARIYCFW
jgi:hypothetical protein